MKLRLACASVSCCVLLAGCGFLKFQSVPFPTYVQSYDYQTAAFLRSSPPVAPGLGLSDGSEYAADDLVLALSITGGGARAAGFTLGVLSELQKIEGPAPDGSGQTNVLEMVDFTSSNSGGSWGVAAYLADWLACERAPDAKCGGTTGYSLIDRRPIISRRLTHSIPSDHAPLRYESIRNDLLLGVTFGMLRDAGAFDAYINSALAPVQSPFVFDSNMLSHYGVTEFLVGGQRELLNSQTPLRSLPLGVAAFASGAVPGWYHVNAKTDLCDRGMRGSEMCRRQPNGALLQIVDGGIYDNYGYRTAFEVFDALPPMPNARRVIIQIDNTTNLPERTVPDTNGPHLLNMALALSFFQQDEVFRRTFQSSARARDIDSTIVDFFSAASDEPTDAQDFSDLRNLHCESQGFKGQHFHECLADPEYLPPGFQPETSGLRGYWQGMLGKTTFQFHYVPNESYPERDWGMGTIMWQLGQLSVRKKADEISCLVFRQTRDGGPCPI